MRFGHRPGFMEYEFCIGITYFEMLIARKGKLKIRSKSASAFDDIQVNVNETAIQTLHIS
jgi:hypothetical protein